MGKLRRVRLDGHGLHGGEPASVLFVREPGPVVVEIGGVPRPVESFRVVSAQFSTTIGDGTALVRTVEHLFAALAGMGIRDGLRVVVQGAEIPVLDGGARALCEALEPRNSPPSRRVVREARIDVDGSIYEFSPCDDVRVE